MKRSVRFKKRSTFFIRKKKYFKSVKIKGFLKRHYFKVPKLWKGRSGLKKSHYFKAPKLWMGRSGLRKVIFFNYSYGIFLDETLEEIYLLLWVVDLVLSWSEIIIIFFHWILRSFQVCWCRNFRLPLGFHRLGCNWDFAGLWSFSPLGGYRLPHGFHPLWCNWDFKGLRYPGSARLWGCRIFRPSLIWSQISLSFGKLLFQELNMYGK